MPGVYSIRLLCIRLQTTCLTLEIFLNLYIRSCLAACFILTLYTTEDGGNGHRNVWKYISSAVLWVFLLFEMDGAPHIIVPVSTIPPVPPD